MPNTFYPSEIPPVAYEKVYLRKALGPPTPKLKSTTPYTTSTQPWMALIDMNSYFAVLEQQANPFLRGKPVGIVKEYGRSCIIAASKEAKKLGIKTGCSLFEARKLAPHLITVPADFDKYFHNTKLLKKIFESLSPNVEIFSLDEAFIDLTACRNLYKNTQHFFEVAQHHVRKELGEWVTFSLGCGENRLQAKLASDLAGPDHFFEITPENLDGCLSEAKVEDICGIGYRLTAKLHQLHIFHPYQLNFFDDLFLLKHFGVFWGPELRRIGKGKDSHLLTLVDKSAEHMKSVGRSKTLFKPTNDQEYIKQMMYNLAEDMCFKARRMRLAGQHVSLLLRDTDGNHFGNELHLQRYVCHTPEVFQLLLRIFEALHLTKAPIIKVSVHLSGLKPLDEIPVCWLPEWARNEKIFTTIDAINEKHGLFTVKPARLLNFHIIHPEVTGFLGDKTYQFQ